ncbi:MAG: hypothetical protein RIQ93_3337, partial [Verrucomicrobiota bacterium]
TIGASTPASGSATTFTIPVTFSGPTGGTVQLNLNATGTGIADVASNALVSGATGPVFTIPSLDMTAPTVSSFTAGTASGATVNFTIVFSEAVTGVNAGASGDFTAVTSAGVTATIGASTPASGSATTFTIPVTFSGPTGGTVQLNLNASGTGIADVAGNALVVGATGPTFTIPASGLPALTSATTAAVTVASPFSYTANWSNSPTAYAVTTTLPSWLTFDATTRRLSGTPTATGSVAVGLSATNATGTGTATLTISVNAAPPPPSAPPPPPKSSQTIVLLPTGDLYPDRSYTLRTTTTSGLPVTLFLIAGEASLAGNVLITTEPGPVAVLASVAGNDQYNPASTTFTLNVKNTRTQTVEFVAPVSAVIVGQPITLAASASSGLPITFSVLAGNATINGSVLTAKSTATIIVRASQPGNVEYAGAAKDILVTPQKAAQSITMTPLTDKLVTSGSITLSATTGSGLPITYTLVSGPATLSGNVLTLTGGSGRVVIRASQSGNDSYLAANDITLSFLVRAIGQQTYFGKLGSDDFAAAFSADNTTGILIARMAGSGEALIVRFRPNPDGAFAAYATSLSPTVRISGSDDTPAVAAAVEPRTFTGRVLDGVITGSVPELGVSFTANVQPATGSTATVSGAYTASSVGSATSNTYLVVGPNGQVYAVSVSPTAVVSGMGTINANGAFSIQASPAGLISGDVSPDGSLTGTVRTGATTAAMAGLSASTVPTERFVNVSSRARVLAGDGSRAFIAGFVINGTTEKQVLVRGVGPGLTAYNVTDAMPNPRLEIRDGAGVLVAQNDDWGNESATAAAIAKVGAFALGANSRDAALLLNLKPGSYTAQLVANGANGSALIEVYDVNNATELVAQPLINLSARSYVDAGPEGMLTAGFVIRGNAPKRVLIRGVGPSPSAYRVPNALSNPTLRLFAADGTVMAQNDDWGTPQPINASQAAAAANEVSAASQAGGAFALPSGSADAAIVITLMPGAYTASVSGAGNATGAALVEVYEIPNQ